MTLSDLLDQVTVEGDIYIKKYDRATDTYVVDEELTHESGNKYGECFLKFIYTEDGYTVLEIADDDE